ncbi:MAG: response regulator [Myxococcales bacterium]|nr:response regulator [Myxococcales bacterium]
MKILIVDDSRAMRMIVKRTLRQAGYGGHDVVEASNGAEAFDIIQGGGVNLVLCDWNMPEMSGIELLKKLKAHGSRVPFGFITSEGSAEKRAMAAEAGALFLLTKPFSADHIATVFEQAKLAS